MDTPTPRPALRAVGRRAAAGLGWLIGVPLGAAGRVRHGKPLHPRGLTFAATLTTSPVPDDATAPLLAHADSRCLVRVSRAMGLPDGIPDIHGVAVRVDEPGGPADLLFATTGTGRLTRYVLLLRRSERTPMTTLVPLRSEGGPLQLRLSPEPDQDGRRAWELSAAHPATARWVPFGRLVTDRRPLQPDPDPPVRFDPVHNVPAGTTQYRWVRLVRDPAYVLARRWSPASRWRPRPRASFRGGGDTWTSE